MRILRIHNSYQQPGGEDAVFFSEQDLLERKKVETRVYHRTNKEIQSRSLPKAVEALWQMNWSKEAYREVQKIIREFRPDLCHIYNTFFMMTPSVHWACYDARIPVVQSFYNYRLVCANGLFLRGEKECELCLKGGRWRATAFRCYRKSFLLTSAIVRMIHDHWGRKTWSKTVDAYIVASASSREKFIQAGLAAEKIYVKPHFVWPDGGIRKEEKGYALYIGRLSAEKGPGFLLDAWASLTDIPLKIVGSGPLLEPLKKKTREQGLSHVEILGYCTKEKCRELLQGASFLIVPSLCRDNGPRTIMEAYCCGVPVLGSSSSGVAEFVTDKKSGRIFRNGDKNDLKEKACWMMSDRVQLQTLGRHARVEYEQCYNEDTNFKMLMNIYQSAVDCHRKAGDGAAK